jgi:hypothetical protein
VPDDIPAAAVGSGRVGYAQRVPPAAASRTDRFLRIYLDDQLAAGVLWREVARRAQRANEGTELGTALTHVATAISEDVALFERIMRGLGMRPSRVKTRLAVAAERLGRTKLNGRLLGYSPLSRFAELDLLAMGIEGKQILWANLRDLTDVGARVPGLDFDQLIERAAWQRAELEPFRQRAGREALAPS